MSRLWRDNPLGRCRTLAGNAFKRRVIVHYHLFKNAGSSVDHILSANFGDRWATVEGGKLWSVLGTDGLADFIRRHPRLLAVSSHTARLPLPQLPGTTVYPIFFLRHPIDRAGSIYHFERRRQDGDFSATTARENDFAGYVRKMLDHPDNEGIVLRNFHTLCLSQAAAGLTDLRRANVDASHLEEARHFLAALPAFGLVEYFDQSAQRLENWLKVSFPGIAFFSARVNFQPQREKELEKRIAAMEQDLGPALFQRLLDANAHDLQLYRHAVEVFHSHSGEDKPTPS